MSPLTPEQRKRAQERIEEELEDEWDDDNDGRTPGAQVLRKFGEIRRRLLIVLGTIGGAAALAGIFSRQIFELLMRPLCAAMPTAHAAAVPGATLVGSCALFPTDPLEPIVVLFKLSLLVGLFAASPVIFYQLWALLSPYMSATARRWVLGFVSSATLFFVGGACFGFFVVFPRAFEFILRVGGERVVSLPTPQSYFGIISMLLLGFGVTFELPLLMFLLARLGVADAGTFSRYRRHALFGLFIFSAAVTPTTDPLTMTAMALPLVALYELGILFARLGKGAGPSFVERRLAELDEFADPEP